MRSRNSTMSLYTIEEVVESFARVGNVKFLQDLSIRVSNTNPMELATDIYTNAEMGIHAYASLQ